MINYKTNRDLSKFYKSLDDPQIEEDKKQIQKLVDDIVKNYKGKIKTFTEDDFLNFFQKKSKISYTAGKIGRFLNFKSSLDTQNQEVLKKLGEFEDFMTNESNKLLFVSQEIKQIGYDKLIEFSKSPKLKDYSNWFVQSANGIKYLLGEKEEYVINMKDTATSNVLDNLREELTGSFVFRMNIEGNIKNLSEDEVRSLRSDTNPETRKKAFDAIRKKYLDKKVQITLGNMYSSIVKNWVTEVKIRNYNTVMEPQNVSEELDNQVVDTLLEEVENSYPLYQKYLGLKAKLLGKNKLEYYDILAPVSSEERKMPFEEGLDLFLKSMKNFDSQFYDFAVDMFEDGRVDVFPKKGKRGGAFASYSKDFDSFVLLNYSSKLNDVSTISHEIGHAIHGYFSQNQALQVFDTGLSLAETASVFNELVFTDYLKQTLSKKEKISLLVDMIEDAFATTFRQIQYILFERRVHQSFYEGKHLTYKDFNNIWREEQEKLVGDKISFDVPADKETGWSGIPHIFAVPFYCYSYAFGNILSFSLYQKYKKDGESFIPKYKDILRAGGSKTPYDLLIQNGIDISSKNFFKDGIAVIEDMVDDLESLV
ncbi:M3 family oligoendopeptidase [Candidatus Absconditicoccus praedator]|uniref:M3 family oligoendopeptidase n=1 Tax=Candidatus Absconditicoccus praedator TaxID=2735562 RepID=UPI001E323EEF|nr:M3 family oligoendopeptidase [Candidatus Absconditicoccus praedator]UFX83140.1 M3 family oligoendopeptidase [Candidatus Absconditicoccus praedator]